MLNYLELENFPSLELVRITASIGAIFLRQRPAQMKNAKPSTATSKRPKVEASTIALATSDQLADIFTKSLSSSHFLYLRSKTMVSFDPLVLRGDENRIIEVTEVEDAQS